MKLTLRSVVMALVVVGMIGAGAHAQSGSNVKIEFAFVAAGKPMPAGAYNIEKTPVGGLILRHRGNGPNTPLLTPITRLGRHDKDRFAELVFDKTGEGLQLSEIWLPGEDGYLLLATTKEHPHVVINGEIKK